MDEDIFGNATEGDNTEVATETEAPVTPTTPTAPDHSAQIAAMQESISQTNKAVQQLASNLQNIFQTAATNAQESDKPVLDQGDILQDLAARGTTGFNERVGKVVSDMANTQLAPHLQRLTESQHELLLAREQLRVDKEYGPGVWDKVIKDPLTADLQNLRQVNYQALADQRSVRALIDRHVGLNYKAIRAIEVEAEKVKKETMDRDNTLPSGRGPRMTLRNDEPDEDAKLFFKEIEEATGEAIDPKQFMALHRAGNTLDDYLAVTAPKKGNGAGARSN